MNILYFNFKSTLTCCFLINLLSVEHVLQSIMFIQADVNAAVAAARKAFHPNSPWRKMDPNKRGVLLNRLADILENEAQYITVSFC